MLPFNIFVIQDKPKRTRIIELYESYSTLPVILLHQQNLILFARPYKLPELFRHYLDKNDDIQSHNTRLKDSVHLYRPNTEFGKRSLKYKAGKFYNNLFEEIRFDLGDSVRYNKSDLRNYLLNTEQ